MEFKGQEVKRQYNILIDGKEFRFDFSRNKIINENGGGYIKNMGEGLIKKIACMRFKERTSYRITNDA